MVTVLDEACNVLPSSIDILAQGLGEELAQKVEACRQRSTIQKRVLEREMEVWQIVDEQRKTEMVAPGKVAEMLGEGNTLVNPVEVDMGEYKRLQRGSVGSDRGG